jgi:hypothetical protein
MAEYEVELVGEVREVYIVSAGDEEEAARMWPGGELKLSEASSMEVTNVKEV